MNNLAVALQTSNQIHFIGLHYLHITYLATRPLNINTACIIKYYNQIRKSDFIHLPR